MEQLRRGQLEASKIFSGDFSAASTLKSMRLRAPLQWPHISGRNITSGMWCNTKRWLQRPDRQRRYRGGLPGLRTRPAASPRYQVARSQRGPRMGQGEIADGRQEREPLGRVLTRRRVCTMRGGSSPFLPDRQPRPTRLRGHHPVGLVPCVSPRSRSERRSQGLMVRPAGMV